MPTKKDVLIFTQTEDVHACAVDYVLRSIGYESHLINLNRFMIDGDALSVHYKEGVRINIGSFSGSFSDVLSSWNRRIPPPNGYLLADYTSKLDRRYLQRNISLSVDGVLSLLDEVFPVNHSAVIHNAANKLRQLRWAEISGFNVPATLVSRDAHEIRTFIRSLPAVCVKPYVTHSWRTDEAVLVANNAMIRQQDIKDDRALELMPHIYQQFIRKKAEYRLTMFGDFYACTKIRTDSMGDTEAVDWRSSMQYLNHLEPAKIDQKIISAARKLMSQLGLRFGTFDLAEDADSKVYFLEVNQAGQWLWQEQQCSDCLVLEPFARYLACASDEFSFNIEAANHQFSSDEVLSAIQRDPRYQSILSFRTGESVYSSASDERIASVSP